MHIPRQLTREPLEQTAAMAMAMAMAMATTKWLHKR